MGLAVHNGKIPDGKASMSAILLGATGALSLVYPRLVSGPVFWTAMAVYNASRSKATMTVSAFLGFPEPGRETDMSLHAHGQCFRFRGAENALQRNTRAVLGGGPAGHPPGRPFQDQRLSAL